MARIAGINIPDNKHARVALTAIYGVGTTRALGICAAAQIEPARRIRDLNETEIEALRREVGKLTVEGDLRRELQMNNKSLMDLGTVSEGKGMVTRLATSVPTSSHVYQYGQIVKTKSVHRRIIDAGQRISALGYEVDKPVPARARASPFASKR